MDKLIALILLGLSIVARAEINQCDTVAAKAAQNVIHFELLKEGQPSTYPGPEVTQFDVLHPNSRYRVSVGGTRPATFYIETWQKSYYCVVDFMKREQ